MDERTFWKLMDLVDRDIVEHDEDAALEPLIVELSKQGSSEIASFQEHLAQRLYALDGRQYAEQAGESGSDDAFLYARCFVVAQGEAAFREVLADPSKMPKSVVEWCEALLGVAGTAHERATGRTADFDTTVSYETGSNGSQWG